MHDIRSLHVPGDAPPSGPTTKNDLVRQGVLAGDRAFTGPYGLQIGIDGTCNYSCVFCAEFSSLRPDSPGGTTHGGHMPEPVFSRLVESAARLDVEQISIVGMGEPLLHPQAFDCFARVKAAGIRLMVTTNGSALSHARVDRLLDAGLDILNVSFSAGTRETYAAVHGQRHERHFDAIQQHLQYLSAEKRSRTASVPRLVMRCTVLKDNIDELEAWVDLAIACGADELVLQNLVAPVFGQHLRPSDDDRLRAAGRMRGCLARLADAGIDSNFTYFMSLYDNSSITPSTYQGYPVGSAFYAQHPCLVGWTYAAVVEWGAVMPCCYCSGAMGNVYEQSFEDIWYGDAYNAFRLRTRHLSTGQAPDGCMCFNGCGSVKDNIRTLLRLDLASADRTT